jgi:hypothetical protein
LVDAVLKMMVSNKNLTEIQTILSSDNVFPPFLHYISAVATHEKANETKSSTT